MRTSGGHSQSQTAISYTSVNIHEEVQYPRPTYRGTVSIHTFYTKSCKCELWGLVEKFWIWAPSRYRSTSTLL